jgi:hypothetical protein
MIKSIEMVANSEYYGAKKHSSSNISEYVRHEIDVWIEFEGETATYQTGVGFYGNDFNCPREGLSLYEISNDALRDLDNDDLDEEVTEIELSSGKKLTVEQAKELLVVLEQRAQEEFDEITAGLSSDPDDYYLDKFDCRYELKVEGLYYCESAGYEHHNEIVEAALYKITDTRDGEVSYEVGESEEDAARRAGILISSWGRDQYIDRDYKVESYIDVLSEKAKHLIGGSVSYTTAQDKLNSGTEYNYVLSTKHRVSKYFVHLEHVAEYLENEEIEIEKLI